MGLFPPGTWFSSWCVVSIDREHRTQSQQSCPRRSPAFKMEPVLSVSSFIPLSWCSYHIVRASFTGIYCTLTLRPPMWDNDINLWVTKFTIHCKIKDPQSRTIKATITLVNIVFHKSPFTPVRTEVQKGRLSSGTTFTRNFMSSRCLIYSQISQEYIHNNQL